MKRISILSIVVMMISCNLSFSQEENISQMKAVKKWESDEVFLIPESVFYDIDANLLYVSNIDGSPVVKDENGFISKIKPDGELVELKWITGLHAPKGMGKYNEKLFVTDIDQLVAIDIKKGEILKKYDAEGASFLNDIAIDPKGTVYVSDLAENAIYRFKDGQIERWFQDTILYRPNGLFFQQGNLYVGCADHIMKINPRTLEYEILAEGTGSIDGLNIDEEGNFIVSDWYGKVQCISTAGETHLLFDTSFETINAADIYYERSNHTLYVPTFRDGRVMAYEITK